MQSPSNTADGMTYADRLYLALVAGFGVCALTGMLTTVFRHFSAGAAVLAGLAAVVTTLYAHRNERTHKPRLATIVGLALVFATACWFRLPPTLNTAGGFDPGLYAAMAMHIAETGDLEITDALHASLEKIPQHVYEEHLVAGVALTDREHSKFIMPFYPMNSVWLATFIRLGGPNAAPWALSLAGLFVVLGLGRLARELSGGRAAAGWLAGALAAVHPGFVLLARFPVSEGLALALTANAAALLARAWRRGAAGGNVRTELAVSATLFTAFFFTRMTGLFYVPFIVTAILLGLGLAAQQRRGPWMAYAMTLVATWLLSLWFYAWRMPPLFGPIMQFMLAPVGGHATVLILAAVAALAGYVWLHVRHNAWIAALSGFIARLSPWALPSALLLSGVPIYLGWKAGGLPAASEYPFEPLHGLALLTHTLPFRLALYVSPGLLALLGLAPLLRRHVRGIGLPAFVLFFAYMTALTVASPYGFLRGSPFYMDRYYLSELAPCALVLSADFCAGLASASLLHRAATGMLLLATVLLFAWAGKTQRTIPLGDTRPFLADVEKMVRPDDLLFFVTDPPPPRLPMRDTLQTPLAYWAGLRVFPIARKNLAQPSLQKLAAAAPRAYVLAVESLGDREGENALKAVSAIGYDLTAPFTAGEIGRVTGHSVSGWQAWLDYPREPIRMRGKMQLYSWKPDLAAHP